MLTKLLFLLGTTLAVGLIWFFAAVAVADQVFAAPLEGGVLLGVLVACLAAGAVVGWRLFVRPPGPRL